MAVAQAAARRKPLADEEAATRMRVLLIDTLGCIVAARGHPAVLQTCAALDGEGPALGMASWRRRPTLEAVLDTGTAIRALDYNDFYWGPGLGGHPSDIFAASLVVAEREGRSIAELLHATAVGYELYIRLVDLMDVEAPADHTTAAALASALVTGLLMRLEEAALAEALALALARGPAMSALRQGRIASVKAAAAALACMNGVLAARMAAQGLTGPRESIAGANGLASFLRRGADPGCLVPEPGSRPKVLQVSLKRYPCIGTAQAAVAGAVEVHRRLAGRDVQRIRVRLADNPLIHHQVEDVYRRPSTRETADHSFYATIGMAVTDGDLTLSQFDAGRWADPDIVELAARITLVADLAGAEEGTFAAEFDVTTADGEPIAIALPFAPGHFRRPLDLSGTMDKFRACIADRLPEDTVAKVAAIMAGSPDTPTGHLLELLVPGADNEPAKVSRI